MTRLARKAPLLVALSLLTSTATAHAECAWVLWARNVTAEGWQIGKAYMDRAGCEAAIQKVWESSDALNKDVDKPPVPRADLRCLPDTVDPRGAKGN